MKKTLFLFLAISIFWGCSSSFDTTDLDPEERLNYVKKLYDDEDYEEAASEFQAIILQYPGNVIVDDAQYYLGMTRFHRGEYIMGAYEFSKLIKNMPASEFIASAQYMLAECYYELSPDFNLDQTYTKKAIEEFQVFIDFFPLNEKVFEAEKKITELYLKLARKEYEIAKIYNKLEYYNASLKYYDTVTEVYHDTEYAPLALYDKIIILVDRKRDDEALNESRKFLEKYPTHKYFKDIDKIKSSLEAKLTAN